MELLTAENLGRTFPLASEKVVALEGVDLEISAGEIPANRFLRIVEGSRSFEVISPPGPNSSQGGVDE